MLAAAAGRYVWVSNVGDATVSRVDVDSGRVDSVGLPVDIPGGVVDGGDGTVWVGSAYKGTVVQVDAKTLAVRDRVELGGRSAEILAVGGGSLWVTEPNPSGQPFPPESLVRLNLATDAVQRRFPIRVPNMVRYGRGAIWVGNFVDGELTEIDVGTNRMTRARVCSEPSDQVVAFGSVWIACVSDGVWRLDPVSLRPTAVLPMGKAVTFAVAAGAGSIWVSNREAGTVTRIDPRTSRVVARIKVGHFTHGLAFAGGAVWVTVAGVKLPADSFNS
jgi:streptogramin lyase